MATSNAPIQGTFSAMSGLILTTSKSPIIARLNAISYNRATSIGCSPVKVHTTNGYGLPYMMLIANVLTCAF